MAATQEQRVGHFDNAAKLEAAFLSHVSAASNELQRVECLDEEQRAEIHAILDALRHDGESHTNIVQQLSGVYRND